MSDNAICIDDLSSNQAKSALEEGVDTLIETVTEYRKIVDDIKLVEDNTLAIQTLSNEFQANQEFSQETIHIYQVACETYMQRINDIFSHNIFPNAEKLIANEGYADDVLSAPINFVMTSIFNTWRVASKAFLDAVTFSYNLTEYFIRNTYDLRKRLDRSGKTPRRSQMRVAAATKLHLSGRIDPKSIKAGFKNAEAILDAVTGDYRNSIYKHYKDCVLGYTELHNNLSQYFSDGRNIPAEVRISTINKFISDSEASLKNTLKKLPQDLEMSGGRIFAFKAKHLRGTPEVFRKDPRIEVPKDAMADVPTKKDIEELLSLVDGVANIVHRRKTNIFTTFYDIEKAITDGIRDLRKNDTNVVAKIMGAIDANTRVIFNHTWYAHPIAECTADVFFTSRKILSYCEDAIELYE